VTVTTSPPRWIKVLDICSEFELLQRRPARCRELLLILEQLGAQDRQRRGARFQDVEKVYEAVRSRGSLGGLVPFQSGEALRRRSRIACLLFERR